MSHDIRVSYCAPNYYVFDGSWHIATMQSFEAVAAYLSMHGVARPYELSVAVVEHIGQPLIGRAA